MTTTPPYVAGGLASAGRSIEATVSADAASVTYTTPASPSPSPTLATIAPTLSSRDAMLAVNAAGKSAGNPAFATRLSRSWSVYFWMGTPSAAAMILTPSPARSAGVSMPAGLSAGTMITRWLPANGVTPPAASPASTSFCGLAVSADRNTSAGAPCSILVSRAADESVETVSVTPGVAVS